MLSSASLSLSDIFTVNTNDAILYTIYYALDNDMLSLLSDIFTAYLHMNTNDNCAGRGEATANSKYLAPPRSSPAQPLCLL